MKKFTMFMAFLLLISWQGMAQFTESFEGTGIPTGWTVINNGDTNTWNFTTPGTGTANSGTQVARIDYDASVAHDDYLITPQIAVTDLVSDRVTFYAKSRSNTFLEDFNVLISTTGTNAGDFTINLAGSLQTAPSTWTMYQYDLSAYEGQNIYIAIQAVSVNEWELYIDDFTIDGNPTCPAPSLLTATNITATTADLGWTENGSATNWQIEWDTTGFVQGTGNMVTTTNNPYNVTGLTPFTSYEFYVRSICGTNDTSTWSGPYTFSYNYCMPVYSSGCSFGARVNNVITTSAVTNINNTGTECANGGGYTDYSSTDTLEVAQGATISINVGVSNYSGGVKVWIDYNQDAIFDVTEIVTQSTSTISAGNSHTANITVPVSALLGETRMRVRVVESTTTFDACSSQSYGEAEDYTVMILPAPSCLAPSALTATNITATTADLGWTEMGTATNWQVEWDTTGFVPGTGNIVVTTNNPYNVTGLTPFTSYEFYVRSICGTNDTSAWSGPYTFAYNHCMPVYSSGCSFGARVNNVITTSAVTNINNTATECANGGGYTDYSSAHTLEVSQGATFDINVGISNYDAGVTVWIDYNQDAIFDASEIITQSATEINAGSNHIANITVPVTALLGETRMRVRAVEGSTSFDPCSNYSYGEAEDYTVMILPAPSCLAPSALTATNITATTADLGWTEMGTATNWQVEWDTTGFVPGTGNMVTTTNNPYNVTGLTPFTSYEFYVRSICGTNDTSTWSGPYTFAYNHCTPTYTYGCTNGARVNNVITTSAVTNINNTATECANGGGYTDYSSAHTLEVSQGATISINVGVSNYGGGVKVWIDYNQDAIFDVTEIVTQSTSTISAGNSHTANITVPVSALLGETRMRVRVVEGSTSFDPCSNYSWGEAEDYKVMILPAPSCLPPSVLTATNITATTADLGWTEMGTATNWQVEWDTTGFVPGTGNIAVTTNNPYNITGLTAQTTYEFYVRSICGTNDTSAWSGPYVFTTPCNTVTTFPFLEDFETTSTTRDCWTQIEELGSASWTYATGSSGGAISTAYSGTENARFVSQSGTNSPVVKLVSPILDLSGVNSPELAFFYGQEMWVSDQNELKVYYRVSVDSAWVQIAHYTSDVAVWTADTLTLPNPSATYQIAFEGINNWGRANVVDDVEVYDAFTCSDPSNLTAFNIQPTNVMLDWTENGTATNWNIEWDVTGFTLGTGNPQAVAAKPYLLQGLTPGTSYDYYVQADCGMGDTSNWVGPYTFTTPPCMPIGLNLGADTTLCANQNITLDAGAGPYTYTWSTGGSAQTEVIDTTLMGGNGTYNVSVTVVDNVSGCIYTDDINITFQTCTDIDELNGANAFNIYPNPTKGILSVSMASTTANTVLTIVDVQGKVVFTKTNFNTSSGVVETIDLSGNDKGIYFVNFTNEQTSIVKKVVLH